MFFIVYQLFTTTLSVPTVAMACGNMHNIILSTVWKLIRYFSQSSESLKWSDTEVADGECCLMYDMADRVETDVANWSLQHQTSCQHHVCVWNNPTLFRISHFCLHVHCPVWILCLIVSVVYLHWWPVAAFLIYFDFNSVIFYLFLDTTVFRILISLTLNLTTFICSRMVLMFTLIVTLYIYLAAFEIDFVLTY